ncbi:hypothetical protein Tco_0256699 [Tanacetum coccineum]
MTAYEANRARGNGAHNEISESAGGVEHVVRSCSYKEFLAYNPLNFKGTERADGLTRWSEKIESELALLCPTMVTPEYKMTERPCTVKCNNYKRTSHLARDCRVLIPDTTQRPPLINQRAPGTYFECGSQGHYRNECLKLKNQNLGNPSRSGGARGRAVVLGGGEAV